MRLNNEPTKRTSDINSYRCDCSSRWLRSFTFDYGVVVIMFTWTTIALTKLKKLAKTHTMQQAADEIGCTKSVIQSRARIEGVSFRKYGERHHSAKYSDHDVYLARALVDEGISIAETARKLEMPQAVVSMYCMNKYRNNDSVQC